MGPYLGILVLEESAVVILLHLSLSLPHPFPLKSHSSTPSPFIETNRCARASKLCTTTSASLRFRHLHPDFCGVVRPCRHHVRAQGVQQLSLDWREIVKLR
jgi:hypothetical protein